MKELEKKELKCKSVIANILDQEEDFRPMTKAVHPLSNICITK